MKVTAFSILNKQRWIGTSIALLFFSFLLLGRPATWRVSKWSSTADSSLPEIHLIVLTDAGPREPQLV
jgi:hypothetical protein